MTSTTFAQPDDDWNAQVFPRWSVGAGPFGLVMQVRAGSRISLPEVHELLLSTAREHHIPAFADPQVVLEYTDVESGRSMQVIESVVVSNGVVTDHSSTADSVQAMSPQECLDYLRVRMHRRGER